MTNYELPKAVDLFTHQVTTANNLWTVFVAATFAAAGFGTSLGTDNLAGYALEDSRPNPATDAAVIGYSLAAIVRPLLAFVTSWQQVLAVRVTDRVGKGIRGAQRTHDACQRVTEKDGKFTFVEFITQITRKKFEKGSDRFGETFD